MDLRYEPSIYLFEHKRVIDWRLMFLADQSLLRDPRLAKLKNASLFSVTGVLQAAYLQHQNASFFRDRHPADVLSAAWPVDQECLAETAAAFRNRIIPITNSTAIIPTPLLMSPVSWETTLTSVVPTKDAPFPQISISPKYSPDCSAGMILV